MKKNLSLKDKVDIIKRKNVDIKLSNEKLAVEFSIEHSTISGIFQNKEKFLQLHADAKSSNLKKTRIQMAQFYSLEETLYKWFEGLHSQNISVFQDLLKMKAVELYNKAIKQGTQFPNFENRYDIHYKTITGESESACLNQIENGIKELQQIIAIFNIDDVYNKDETGLFFHLGLNKTLVLKGDKAKDNMETDEANNDIVELILALNSLSIAEPSIDSLIANEYIEIDNNLVSAELLTDDELVEEIFLAEEVLHPIQVDMEDLSEEEETSISVKVERKALVIVRKFLEQREFITE
ncbi:2996_t:CDS:2, partial [Acaulospora morrowiae]